MRNTLYAIVAACTAMLATSGIVALATAAPAKPPVHDAALQSAEAALTAHLDDVIHHQLDAVQHRLAARHH